jgi:hypothetical protein
LVGKTIVEQVLLLFEILKTRQLVEQELVQKAAIGEELGQLAGEQVGKIVEGLAVEEQAGSSAVGLAGSSAVGLAGSSAGELVGSSAEELTGNFVGELVLKAGNSAEVEQVVNFLALAPS